MSDDAVAAVKHDDAQPNVAIWDLRIMPLFTGWSHGNLMKFRQLVLRYWCKRFLKEAVGAISIGTSRGEGEKSKDIRNSLCSLSEFSCSQNVDDNARFSPKFESPFDKHSIVRNAVRSAVHSSFFDWSFGSTLHY